jgi:hypothetical protein
VGRRGEATLVVPWSGCGFRGGMPGKSRREGMMGDMGGRRRRGIWLRASKGRGGLLPTAGMVDRREWGREASRGSGCRDEVCKPWSPSMEWYAHTMVADIAFHGMGRVSLQGGKKNEVAICRWGGVGRGGSCAHGRVPVAAGAAAGAGARGGNRTVSDGGGVGNQTVEMEAGAWLC